MYSLHPKKIGEVKTDEFIAENEEALQKLKIESEELIKGYADKEKMLSMRTALITHAVWNDLESLNDIVEEGISRECDEKSSPLLDELFGSILIWMALEWDVDKGLLEKNDGKYKATSFGNGVYSRKNKVFSKRGKKKTSSKKRGK